MESITNFRNRLIKCQKKKKDLKLMQNIFKDILFYSYFVGLYYRYGKN